MDSLLTIAKIALPTISMIALFWWGTHRWCHRKDPLVVFVTYPATEGARDFVDGALLDFARDTGLGEVSGGGSMTSADDTPMACTDIDLFYPARPAYHALVMKLRAIDMPKETVLRSRFGIEALYDIRIAEI